MNETVTTETAPETTAAAPAPKKAPKPKNKPATAAKAKPSKNGKPAPLTEDQKDRAAAKAVELNLIHFRVLRALVKSGKAMTYRDIEAKTGYYAPLTKVCRAEYEDSLCTIGLVKEEIEENGNKNVLVFTATAKGRKLLGK